MTLTPRGQHTLPLMEEFRRIYGMLEKPVAALTSLLVYLSGDRMYHQRAAGFVPFDAAAGTVGVVYGEASYAAQTVRVYGRTTDGSNPVSGHTVTVTTPAGGATGSLASWVTGAAQVDIEIEIAQGAEFVIDVVAHATKSFNINVGLTPAEASLLSMDDYPAEIRTEGD